MGIHCLSLGFCAIILSGHHSYVNFVTFAEVISKGGGHDEVMSNVTKCSVTPKPAATSHTPKNSTSAATAVCKLRIRTAASGIRLKTAANNCNRNKSQDSSKVAIVDMQQNAKRQITNKSQEKILVRKLCVIFKITFVQIDPCPWFM